MKRILVVDDNDQNRYMLGALLRGKGYEVVMAADGIEALNALDAIRDTPPDLIITDILMPGMDGYTLCRKCKADEHLCRIPLVFYTATYTDSKDEEFALSLGAARFIIKPEEPEVLMRMLEEVIEEQQALPHALPPEPYLEESVYLKNYSERLIHKLEDKLKQLESAKNHLELEVTERKMIEEALKQSEKKLKIRARIADAFLTVPDEDIFAAVLKIALEVMESEVGIFGYIDRNGSLVVPSMAGTLLNLSHEKSRNIVIPRNAWGESLWSQSVKEGKASHSNQLIPISEGHIPIRRYISMPVTHQEKVIGLLFVANKETDYGREDIQLLENIVTVLAMILSVRLTHEREREERALLENQLRQASKMEAVGRLAGGMAHDLNNILQVMSLSSGLLMNRLPAYSDTYEFAEEIYRSVERASALTSQLLAISRRQILKKEDLALNEAVRDMIRMIKRVIGEDIEVRLIEGDSLDNVYADRGQMEQILLNLCVNARDAMPEGGVLTIETKNVMKKSEAGEPRLLPSQSRYILLTVTDTGCGMDKETQGRIFEPFYTTKEAGKGTGLGLPTVYGIVQQHQGEIQVSSEVGRGTTFQVFLPSTEKSEASIRAEAFARSRGGTETILVAEDYETVRKLAANILEGAGYRVLMAADGVEALEISKKYQGDIHLALVDMVIPKMGGKALYEVLHKEQPGLRFLFSSGYATSPLHLEFLQKEKVMLIQKPYAPSTLLARIREVLSPP
ncbi:MAG: response regulator [Candidatus Eremiobacteraeota bacterium]|nr:response regulator [Candidatus Eremiobacteraeota bacterium]